MEIAMLCNETIAYEYLSRIYPEKEAKALAYRNVTAFTTYLRQGYALFASAKSSNHWSQPILLYYGMSGLLKAVALTKDPDYPANTLLLQHGLTSPKRKKTPYRWLYDEIRVQKDGFFGYLCHQLSIPIQAGQRYTMNDLCGFLPKLSPLFQCIYGKSAQISLVVQHNGEQDWRISITDHVLDRFYISLSSLAERLNRAAGKVFFHVNKQQLYCEQPPDTHPWIYSTEQNNYSLWIGDPIQLQPLPEIIAYYALFFSLSMLCRYHAPLWAELIANTEKEQVIIQTCIDDVHQHFLTLIESLLKK
jgi:hypothetical protein